MTSKMHKQRLSKQEIEDARLVSGILIRIVKSIVRNRDRPTIVQSTKSGFVPHLVFAFIMPNTSIKQRKLIDGVVVL